MNGFYTIKSKEELIRFIEEDKKACFGSDNVSFEKKIRNPFKTNLFRFFGLLRKYEYLCFKRDNCKNSIISKLVSLQIKMIDIKKNKLSLKLGVEITPFSCKKNIRSIWDIFKYSL